MSTLTVTGTEGPWYIHGQRVTKTEIQAWTGKMPSDLLKAIGRKKPGEAANEDVAAAKMALVYEYERVLTPAQRTYVRKSVTNARQVRDTLDGLLRNKVSKGIFTVLRVINPISWLLAPFKKLVAQGVLSMGRAAAADLSSLDASRAPAWRMLIGSLWGGITTEIVMIAGSLALSGLVDVSVDDFGDVAASFSFADALGNAADFVSDALASGSPYAWEPF